MLCHLRTLILKLWFRDLNLDSPSAMSYGMGLKYIPQELSFFLGVSEAWPSSQVWGSFQLQVLEKPLAQHRFLVQPPRIPGKSTALMIPQAAL